MRGKAFPLGSKQALPLPPSAGTPRNAPSPTHVIPRTKPCHSRATPMSFPCNTNVIPALRRRNPKSEIIGSSPIMTQGSSPIMTQESSPIMTQGSSPAMAQTSSHNHGTGIYPRISFTIEEASLVSSSILAKSPALIKSPLTIQLPPHARILSQER